MEGKPKKIKIDRYNHRENTRREESKYLGV